MLNLFQRLSSTHISSITSHIMLSLADALMALIPYLSAILCISELLNPSPDTHKLSLYYALAIVCFGLRVLITRRCYLDMNFFGYAVSRNIRSRLAEKFRSLSIGKLQSYSPGELHNVAIQDVEYTEQILSHLYAQVMTVLGLVTLIIAALFSLNWQLAIAAVVPLPLGIWTAWKLTHISRKQGLTLLKALNTFNAGVLEYIQNLPLLRSYNLAGSKFNRLDAAMRNLSEQAIRMEWVGGLAPISFIMIIQLGLPLILILGNHLHIEQDLELITLIAFMLLTPRLYRPLTQIAVFTAEINFMSLAAARVDAVLTVPTKNIQSSPSNPQKKGAAIVEFDDVSFSYQSRTVLNRISFSANPRQKIALVGSSGAGKTTLLRLIAGFWEPQQGQIKVQGIPIEKWPSDQLLHQISIVFQDVFLFDDSIENNLRAGNDTLTQCDLERACRKANCHDFIISLPGGYKTKLISSAQRLSGGEKQRLSIARALLKDSPILLLDEATSALDPENEHFIQTALDELMKDKTVFIIAHKLGSIRNADQILVMDQGKIVERGTHDTLLALGNLYSDLWQKQRAAKGWCLKYGPKNTKEPANKPLS